MVRTHTVFPTHRAQRQLKKDNVGISRMDDRIIQIRRAV
ncbi:hypothetical protein EYZ11_004941 [Aspergillus tanneri]|uniref:Uncharacterized protein n=1 Tax=Aspergillus tanneri TaxID=1220188 RepID=A0A4S3JJ53_9EURO|nr:hypothetical protein EYZ11_004941 [Aspergillus tanneri]